MCFSQLLFKETKHRKEDLVNMPKLQKGNDLDTRP